MAGGNLKSPNGHWHCGRPGDGIFFKFLVWDGAQFGHHVGGKSRGWTKEGKGQQHTKYIRRRTEKNKVTLTQSKRLITPKKGKDRNAEKKKKGRQRLGYKKKPHARKLRGHGKCRTLGCSRAGLRCKCRGWRTQGGQEKSTGSRGGHDKKKKSEENAPQHRKRNRRKNRNSHRKDRVRKPLEEGAKKLSTGLKEGKHFS